MAGDSPVLTMAGLCLLSSHLQHSPHAQYVPTSTDAGTFCMDLSTPEGNFSVRKRSRAAVCQCS